MKVSVNWMQYYCDKYDMNVKILPEGGIDELVQKIGAQLGAVEEVKALGEKYKGIVIAKVVSCIKHPDADKLSLCKVDDGGKVANVDRDEDGYVQVVCGAPNVREGLTVAWLPPGVTVPASVDTDPFVLESREIRGQVSNGMLASAHELALSDDHSGIVELDEGKPGDDFAEVFELDDYIIDIENKMFTHRPDCFGQLGVAREIAGITGQQFKSPPTYANSHTIKNDDNGLSVTINNELPKLVPRFMVQVFEDISVGPSPFWLQTYLSKVGVRSINNIVDQTNFFMLLTGQPMHAYDYDKVKALSNGDPTLVVRHPQKGEKIKLLNGKEIEPRAEAIMIATDKQLIGIGGVMGGSETEVDENTKRIILECANFDMYSIRRTSMENGLFTDAVTRFSKGQSPLQCERVLAWAQDAIVQHTKAKPGNVYDDGSQFTEPAAVTVSTEFINDRLGSDLSADDMAKLLTNVEFEVAVNGEDLTVKPPFWRTDIEIAEDLVEEVGRLYGFDNLPAELPLRPMQATPRNAMLDFKAQVRETLSSAGANEVLTYSFVHGDLLGKVGQSTDHAYQLSNALSPDLQYYRISLLPSLLDKVYANVRAGVDELALFEMNTTHSKAQAKEGELPAEIQSLSLVYAAADKAKHPDGAAYYQARKYLTTVLGTFGITPKFEVIGKDPGSPLSQPFDHMRSALVVDVVTGTLIGIVGGFKASVRRSLKLPAFSAGFELSLNNLQQLAASQKPYITLPKFPSVQQDISLKVADKVRYQQLFNLVSAELEKRKPSNTHIQLEAVDIYQKDSGSKHITLRLIIAAFDRTLKAEEVNSLLDEVAATAKQELGAERL